MDTLERLDALDAIRMLKTRYFRFVDTKDWTGLEALFTEDAVFEIAAVSGQGGATGRKDTVLSGRRRILDFISQSMQGCISVHHGHGHEVDCLSPTEASGIIAMEDRVDWPERGIWLHGFGHYRENYRREDGTWRISRSRLTRLRFNSNLPATEPS